MNGGSNTQHIRSILIDDPRVDFCDPLAVKIWCRHLGVTRDQLRQAVLRVGPRIADLEREIRR